MATPINLDATVSSDGKIEIAVPQLTPGQRVHIVIEPEEVSQDQERPAIDILREAPGHLLFQTAEEVDAYIRQERDAWER
jgi:hypothetical protein